MCDEFTPLKASLLCCFCCCCRCLILMIFELVLKIGEWWGAEGEKDGSLNHGTTSRAIAGSVTVYWETKIQSTCKLRTSCPWCPWEDWSFCIKWPAPLIMHLPCQRRERNTFFGGQKQQILFSSPMIQSRSAVNAKQYGFLERWLTISFFFFKAIIHRVWISSSWASKSVIQMKRMAKIPRSQKIDLGQTTAPGQMTFRTCASVLIRKWKSKLKDWDCLLG